MIGVVGGLLTALFWTGAGTCSARMARQVGPVGALAIGNLIGVILVTAAALIWTGPPASVPFDDIAGALGYGAGATLGLGVIFKAFATTKVGLVSATVSMNGAIAAILSVVVLGERLPPAALLPLVAIAAGVGLTAYRGDDVGVAPGSVRRGVLLAALGAALFGSAIVSGATVGGLAPIWVVAIGRAVGLVLVTVPIALSSGLPRIDRSLAPYAIGSPAFDAAGFATLLVASRHGVAVPAVLATGSAVLLALSAVIVFRERLSRTQWAGVLTTVAGVAALTALRGS